MQKKRHTITKRKLRSSYATSIISISLVLFLLGLVGLLLLNTKRLSIHIKENIGFSVILKDEAKEVDIIRLQKILMQRNMLSPLTTSPVKKLPGKQPKNLVRILSNSSDIIHYRLPSM